MCVHMLLLDFLQMVPHVESATSLSIICNFFYHLGCTLRFSFNGDLLFAGAMSNSCTQHMWIVGSN